MFLTTSIEVNKQNVKALLESGRENVFVIPEYQRPYAWTVDQIQTLFDDLIEYTSLHPVSSSNNNQDAYFLGCIVSFKNDKQEQEIIDGQQRITTLFLLLRAIYTKLEVSQPVKEVKNFKQLIEPTIWQKDKLTGDVNFTKPLLVSRAIDDKRNTIFNIILKTGKVNNLAQDNYSLNYSLMQQLLDEYAQEQALTFYDLIFNILNETILLPIQADSQDTALTIFSTLNDRGLPLSDADIFKAKIYNHVSNKNIFIDKWQSLDERSHYAEESIQKLFYYYMFYLRAINNDRKSTTPGIRKFYSKNNFKQLFNPNLLDDLNQLLNIWVVINKHETIKGELWSQDNDILKLLDMLSSYPNEFWKYPVVVYYLKNYDKDNFKNKFCSFLKHFFVTIAARYIITPTINAVKGNILNLNASIVHDPEPNFNFQPINEAELKEQIKNPHRSMVRMILKTIAYQEQDELLPDKWEIEHILPQKWQSTYFENISDTEIKDLVEHIGNKTPFEKRLNIIASNGYFEKKKEQYKNSNVKITQKLSELNNNEWTLNSIRERDIYLSNQVVTLFKLWGLNESNKVKSQKPNISDLRQIRKYKNMGWV